MRRNVNAGGEGEDKAPSRERYWWGRVGSQKDLLMVGGGIAGKVKGNARKER